MVDKITPNDSRVQRKTTNLNGVTYSYILAEPSGKPINTIFLIHGWPDLSFGWRYQIPLLTSLGLRVVVPDMMGYAGTDAPEALSFYTFKRAADDVATLAQQLGVSSIILGGHDWGGAVVYRIALWYPKLISAVISVCTPFWLPRTKYVPQTSETVMPNFRYQLQLKGPDVEGTIVGETKIRQFLNGMYGGTTPEGEFTFDVSHGCHFERLETVGPSPLLSAEEMDFYVKSYARNGMRGPLNWYRTLELNYQEEKEMADRIQKQGDEFKFECPVLFVAGTNDGALPPSVSKGMDVYFKDLRRGEVNSGHWMLWQKPKEINEYIKEFIEEVKGGDKAHL